MNKSRCLALIGLCAASMLAQAGSFEDLARVISVTERTGGSGQMTKVCDGDGMAANGERGVAGALIGGTTGALVGSQVGKGNGKVAAAAVGAVAGALVGDRVQNGNSVVMGGGAQRCRYVDSGMHRVIGYTVTYEYQGRTYTENVPFNPGDTMRVRVSLMPVRDNTPTLFH